MIGNEFRNALRSGKTVYGTLISSTSPKMFDVVKSLNLDYIFICNEHVLYNQDALGWMCRAYKAAGINPVVRILSPDPYLATQALDAGAGAILVPYVENIDDIYELVGAVKFRPLKGKKLKKLLYGEEKLTREMAEYLKKHNQDNTLLINIESPTGVENLDVFFDIQSVDGLGVDGIVLGPHDLSVAYDMPEKYKSQEFLELSCGIIAKARARGIAAGGHNGSRGNFDLQFAWAKAGANIILNSSDMFLFADKLQEEMNQIRQMKGEQINTNNDVQSI